MLRPTSRVELWVQLRDQLADRILDGRIPADHKLWSQTELADLLGVSRGTTIRAYDGLRQEGLVMFVPGRGLFSPMTGRDRRGQEEADAYSAKVNGCSQIPHVTGPSAATRALIRILRGGSHWQVSTRLLRSA